MVQSPSYNMIQQILRHHKILKKLQDAAIWTWPSSKGQKGQTKVNIQCPRFWCGEHPCKVTTWCMQLLRSYHVHKATWPSASLKVEKGHTKVNMELVQDLDVENTSNTKYYKVTTWYRQFMKSYRVHKVPDAACLPSAKATTILLQPLGLRGKTLCIYRKSLLQHQLSILLNKSQNGGWAIWGHRHYKIFMICTPPPARAHDIALHHDKTISCLTIEKVMCAEHVPIILTQLSPLPQTRPEVPLQKLIYFKSSK